MKKYEGSEALMEASVEDLAATDSMNAAAAQELYDYLHPSE